MAVKKINIAVDGYAGTGKSSTAKQVAARLEYLFIDSGAMYRAVSLYFLRHDIDFHSDNPSVWAALKDIFIDFVPKEGQSYPEVRLNGEKVEKDIRSQAVSDIVSPVAVLKSVRKEMVAQQQRKGLDKGVEWDRIDSTREEGPLRQAADAILIDTTEMQLIQQIDLVYKLAMEQILS